MFEPIGRRRSTTTLIAAAGAIVALAGCGKAAGPDARGDGVETVAVRIGAGGTAATATRNTTRLGGRDAFVDAAAIARAAYPGLTPQTRPQAVAIADASDWPAALAAAALASAPLGAPLLYAEDGKLPAASARALQALRPTGSSALDGAQVLLLGASLEAPPGYRARGATQADPYALAASIAQLAAIAQGTSPREVIVVAADGPQALAMPAASLAAQNGAPILLVNRGGVPGPTATELKALHHPTIYTVGSTAIGAHTLAQLGRLGTVKRVESSAGEDKTAADNAIAVARYSDGAFGFGIVEAGHGLAFANESRPLDGPAAAILAATGDYAPLLLLGPDGRVPPVLHSYLSDIQPAAPDSQPVRGVYNHGWLIGDESAIPADTQAELDAILEILPQSSGGAGQAPAVPGE